MTEEEKWKQNIEHAKTLNGGTHAQVKLDTATGAMVCEALIAPYLCPSCANTHIEIGTDSGLRIAFVLTPQEAEHLANGLNAPTPIQREELHS